VQFKMYVGHLTVLDQRGWLLIVIFFFSSRRRHTRWPRDWSSDVCSSDLRLDEAEQLQLPVGQVAVEVVLLLAAGDEQQLAVPARSEERRVGKECRSRWSA